MKQLSVFVQIVMIGVLCSCEHSLDNTPKVAPEKEVIPRLVSQKMIPMSASAYVLKKLESLQVSGFLSDNALQVKELYKLKTDTGYDFYGLTLESKEAGDAEDHLLALYPNLDGEDKALVFSGKDGQDELEFRVSDLEGKLLLDSRKLPVAQSRAKHNQGDNSNMGGGRQQNCDAVSDSYGACMDCAIDLLYGDWLSFATCSLSGNFLCLAAAAIHCA